MGDSVTMNDVLQLAEKSRGGRPFPLPRRLVALTVKGTNFDTVHDSLEDLRAGKITEIPAYLPVYEVLPKEFFLGMMAAFGVAMVTGAFDLGDDTINKKYTDVQPVKIAEFITKYWEGK